MLLNDEYNKSTPIRDTATPFLKEYEAYAATTGVENETHRRVNFKLEVYHHDGHATKQDQEWLEMNCHLIPFTKMPRQGKTLFYDLERNQTITDDQYITGDQVYIYGFNLTAVKEKQIVSRI